VRPIGSVVGARVRKSPYLTFDLVPWSLVGVEVFDPDTYLAEGRPLIPTDQEGYLVEPVFEALSLRGKRIHQWEGSG